MYGLLPLTQNEPAILGYTDLSHISMTDEFRIYLALAHEGQAILIKTPASVTHPVQLHDRGLVQVYERYVAWGTWVPQ
jgi:predicted transcriptional regulator